MVSSRLLILWSWLLVGVVALRGGSFSLQDLMVASCLFVGFWLAPKYAPKLSTKETLSLSLIFSAVVAPALGASYFTAGSSVTHITYAAILLICTSATFFALSKFAAHTGMIITALWLGLPILAEYLAADVTGASRGYLFAISPLAVFSQSDASGITRNFIISAVFAVVIFLALTLYTKTDKKTHSTHLT